MKKLDLADWLELPEGVALQREMILGQGERLTLCVGLYEIVASTRADGSYRCVVLRDGNVCKEAFIHGKEWYRNLWLYEQVHALKDSTQAGD